MAKDPAVLFYCSDFLTGTTGLTMEERGQYITLLCLQHQQGHLSEKTIRLAVGSASVDVLSKFKKDDNGNFFNERMEEEIEKRSNFVKIRQNNGKLGGRPKTEIKPTGKPKDNLQDNLQGNLPENENENTNEDILEKEIENFLVPDMLKIFKISNPKYKENQERDFPPLFSIAKFLSEHGNLNGSIQDNKTAILLAWEPLCQIISTDKWFATKPLSVISKMIQEITQIALHGKSNGKPNYGSKERAQEFDRMYAERYPNG